MKTESTRTDRLKAALATWWNGTGLRCLLKVAAVLWVMEAVKAQSDFKAIFSLVAAWLIFAAAEKY